MHPAWYNLLASIGAGCHCCCCCRLWIFNKSVKARKQRTNCVRNPLGNQNGMEKSTHTHEKKILCTFYLRTDAPDFNEPNPTRLRISIKLQHTHSVGPKIKYAANDIAQWEIHCFVLYCYCYVSFRLMCFSLSLCVFMFDLLAPQHSQQNWYNDIQKRLRASYRVSVCVCVRQTIAKHLCTRT